MSTIKRIIFMVLVVVGLGVLMGCGGKEKEEMEVAATAVSPTVVPATTAPTATQVSKPAPAAVILGDEARSEEGGYTFQPIPDYEVVSYGGTVSMMAPNADSDVGPMVMMMGGQTAEMTNEDLLDQLKSGTDMTIGTVEAITVQGVSGLAADITGNNNGKAMQGRIALLMVTPTQQFVLLFGAPADQWEALSPYFEGMLTAVTFFDPVVSTDPGVSDAPSTAAPTSSLEPGRYSYVNSNVVRDIVVQNGVAYAATLGGLAAWNLSDGYAMNYTPLQGMGHVSSYAVTACEINGEEQIVIGTLQGISLFDPFYGRWDTTPLTPEDSLVATSKIDRLFCDQANGRLLIAYSGLGVLDLATGDFERFTKDNGLSWNAIFDIAVNGRDIWAASGYNGLSQISDGQVTIHNKASGMPDERAYSLAFAPDGTLWVGGAAGLMQFKNGQWTLYDVLADINEVELAADGTLWLAAASMGGGSLCHFDPQTGECAAVYPEPENQGILALSLDDQGRPVYGTDKGVYRFDAAADTAVPYINEYDMLLSNDVASLTTAPNGMLWLGTNAGIQVLDPAFPDMLWTTYRKADTPGMGGNWGVAAAAAPDGTVWIAMTNGDASRFRDGVWQSFAELRSYDSVAVDADGRAWFGDEDKGIVVLNDDGSTAMTLTMAEGLPSNRVTALLADGETMWIAQDVGLTKYADGQVTLVLDKNRLPHPYLQALALDAAGKLLVGANLSIVRYDGDQTETLINFQQEKQMAWLTTLAVERDGRIWAGTANGLYYSDNGSDWNRMTTADGLLANYISALLVDQYGTLWIGGGGLLHIVP